MIEVNTSLTDLDFLEEVLRQCKTDQVALAVARRLTGETIPNRFIDRGVFIVVERATYQRIKRMDGSDNSSYLLSQAYGGFLAPFTELVEGILDDLATPVTRKPK